MKRVAFIIAILTACTSKNNFKAYTASNKATVFVSLLPDCPASQNYILTLNELYFKYQSANIAFYGVFPGFVPDSEITVFRNQFKPAFPLIHDSLMLKELKAHIAPEAFVLNNKSQTLYRGRIDDWMFAVGKLRTNITSHELQDAIEDVIHDRQIKVPQTTPVGCIID